MLCILNQSTNPYFNIASEEYLLKNLTEDIFMLYRNTPSIIVGKHQNTFAEINHHYVKEYQIDVIRRLSGGGTVFHDLGNLNFSFIQNGNDGELVDFKRFTNPILQVLRDLGVPADRSGRNDLIIHDLKFSGNAEHIYKNRTLHHGTLLFSSQLENLGTALHVNVNHYQDKAVKSVRSKVTNITQHLPSPLSMDQFIEKIHLHILRNMPDTHLYQFNEKDNQQINQLVKEKYGTWDWNFGYSPRFTLQKTECINGKNILLFLLIEKGIIKQASIDINHSNAALLEKELLDKPYREDIILKTISCFFDQPEVDSFLKLFF